ncbi:MAG: hypothetical protein KQH57_18745 [Actinomycetales bacterium]|nr:hypothetical protein [Actinomycetales bacterium]
MRSITRALSLVVAMIAAATALAGQDASAAEAQNGPKSQVDQTYTALDGVVHYAFDPSRLPGYTVHPLIGTPENDGSCTFTESGSGSVAENARSGGPKLTVSTEITFDPVTCRSEFAVATYLASEVPAPVAEDRQAVDGLTGEGTASGFPVDASGKPSSAAASYTWYGALNGVYKDPIPATVTKTEASLGWGPTGATYHWNGYYYLSGTGWSMTWWSPVNTSYYTNTRANFKNTAFCNPFASTYTNHSRDEFRGYTSGSWYWYWTHSKSGDCASLLSSTYYLDTP